MKKEKSASQFQRMKDEYLERKNNPEIRFPEDMSDEEYLRYMNYRREGIKKDEERKNKIILKPNKKKRKLKSILTSD